MAEKQGHLDRLSPIDASFLHQERRASHMHVGGLVIFEGPPPTREDFCDHIESRLPLVPRYRQTVRFVPLNLGRPLCVDSPKSRAGRDLDGLARELIPVENATWQEEEAAPRRPRLRLFGKG